MAQAHLSHSPRLNMALVRLTTLPKLAAAPQGLERAWEHAAMILAAAPDASAKEASIDWSPLLAAAQIVYGEYHDLDPAPAGEALDALRVAVEAVEAAAEMDSGIAAHGRKGWALLGLVGHGMLGDFGYPTSKDKLPKLQMEHPARLLACGLASNDWLGVASPGAGILDGPYREAALAAINFVYDRVEADPEAAKACYREAMIAAIKDPDGDSFSIALLSYARLALAQHELAWRARQGQPA